MNIFSRCSLSFKGKLLREPKEAISIPKDVVLHIHVTNLAIFEQFIPKFVNLFPQFEYLLTTPDQKIAKQLSYDVKWDFWQKSNSINARAAPFISHVCSS